MTTNRRIGLWLIGARGGVASTVIVGLAALRRGLIGTTGLVTELPLFHGLDLLRWDELVLGGHEIRDIPLAGETLRVASEMRAVRAEVVAACAAEIDEIDRRIRPGTIHNVGPTVRGLAGRWVPCEPSLRESIARLRADLTDFRRDAGAEHVVVVNLASTEPLADPGGLPPAWADLERALAAGDPAVAALPASSLYAIAAFEEGCSYVNFTPSLGAAPPAIDELARLRAVPHFGCDGKTGETLLKSVLAPMFADRHLQVMSWVGHNIFGNMDGRVLDDPLNKQSKITSKDHLLGEILGYRPQTLVSIEFIESLGDWKTAWDHVHFAGFLGTPMTLQFIWQGCDSVLAAPLVLDLVRLVERARRRGQTGRLPFLASFFKSPLGVAEHRFERQFQMLTAWAEEVRAES